MHLSRHIMKPSFIYSLCKCCARNFQVLRLIHSFADRADTSLVHMYPAMNTTSRVGRVSTEEPKSEDPQLALLSSGLLGAVAMALSTEPLQSPYRFWLASVIEAFLRGGRPESHRAAIAHLPVAFSSSSSPGSSNTSDRARTSQGTETRRSYQSTIAREEDLSGINEQQERNRVSDGSGASEKEEGPTCLVDFLVQQILRPGPSQLSPPQSQPNQNDNGGGSGEMPAATSGTENEDGGGIGAVDSENAAEDDGGSSNGDLQSACDLLAEVVKFSPTALLALQKALIGWRPPLSSSSCSSSVDTKATSAEEGTAEELKNGDLPVEMAPENVDKDSDIILIEHEDDSDYKGAPAGGEDDAEQPLLPPGFDRLLDVLLANVVDANVLFRAVLLTLDSTLCPLTAAFEKKGATDSGVSGGASVAAGESGRPFLPSRSCRRPMRVFSLRRSPCAKQSPAPGSSRESTAAVEVDADTPTPDAAAEATGAPAMQQASEALSRTFSRLRQWLAAVEARVLAALLASVSFEDVSHENVCAINTALLLLLLAKRQQRLPALLSAVDAVADGADKKGRGAGSERDRLAGKAELPVEASLLEVEAMIDGGRTGESQSGGVESTRDSGTCKQERSESLRRHFRPLLWFWCEYYGPRGRDRRSLETSSRITYKVSPGFVRNFSRALQKATEYPTKPF